MTPLVERAVVVGGAGVRRQHGAAVLGGAALLLAAVGVRASRRRRAAAVGPVRVAHQRQRTRALIPAGQIRAAGARPTGDFSLQAFIDVCVGGKGFDKLSLGIIP